MDSRHILFQVHDFSQSVRPTWCQNTFWSRSVGSFGLPGENESVYRVRRGEREIWRDQEERVWRRSPSSISERDSALSWSSDAEHIAGYCSSVGYCDRIPALHLAIRRKTASCALWRGL